MYIFFFKQIWNYDYRCVSLYYVWNLSFKFNNIFDQDN